MSRAGWGVSAALFATLLSSLLHVDHVGLIPVFLLLACAVIAFLRPDAGLIAAAATVPIAWYTGSQFWNPNVAWAETVVVAALTGLSLNGVGRRNGDGHVADAVSAPAILFGAIVIASLVAGLGVKALRLGPGFTAAVVTQLTREYFTDLRGFPALHAGMLLVEGLLLFAAAARIAAGHPRRDAYLRRVAAATAASAAVAATLNIWRLLQAAARGGSFFASLGELADKFRWNVHYADFNAAGSYFAMAAILAVALAASASRRRRAGWIACTVVIALALWLTSSRVAVLAGVIGPGAALMLREMTRGRQYVMRAAAAATAALVLLVVVAVALPQRGSQKSSLLAADVRVGLIQTGARMIASHPVFGIGLAEFYQRTGEFSSPELIAKFPVAMHENAHNNFVQIAAELGVAGGLLFAWLVGAALVVIGRRAVAASEPFLLLTLAAVGAFSLTCLGGHPLLVPEPGYVFWTMLGAAVGASSAPGPQASWRRWLVPICIGAIALTLPWRMRAAAQDADLEHVGIGVSATWQLSPDGIRYRQAEGHATLFVPAGAFTFSVNPRGDAPLRLELRLDGRLANVTWIAPQRWNDLSLPARTAQTGAQYARLDLRLVDADQTAIWITKVQPIQ